MTRIFLVLALGLAGLVAGLWARGGPQALTLAELDARLSGPAGPHDWPVPVYHLGHSLVGRDMPAMLAQLGGHSYHSQLGWGASLQQHWQGDVPGFDAENGTAAFRPALEAFDSGDYGVIVLTEMVELQDAIAYHDSAAALARWAMRARQANPDVRLFLYETWHGTDDPAGWAARIAADGPALWHGTLLAQAMAQDGVGDIHVIPGGPVLAAVAAAIAAGDVPHLTSRDALFAQTGDKVDPIHLGDLGHYIIAMTHFAVITGQSPVGLPHDLRRADGTVATPIAPETAQALQKVVWSVVTGYPYTGLTKG
ncbi:MAG: hypothetical protein MUD11_05785 [Rhodobacteraceae bacterium]|jgi:hypothetical protein|nr:hypothetical protein [Paracoccaceae bacterium]